MATFYELLGEEEGIRKLVSAFYPKVEANEILSPLFPKDFSDIMYKQELFLTQFFGGPSLYSDKYGHPMMRARHLPFPITQKHADAWLDCMNCALEEIQVEPSLREAVIHRLQAPAYHFINQN